MNFRNIFKTNKNMNDEKNIATDQTMINEKTQTMPNKVAMKNEEFGKLMNVAEELNLELAPIGEKPANPEYDGRDYEIRKRNNAYNNFFQEISTYELIGVYHTKEDTLEFTNDLRYALGLVWLTDEILK